MTPRLLVCEYTARITDPTVWSSHLHAGLYDHLTTTGADDTSIETREKREQIFFLQCTQWYNLSVFSQTSFVCNAQNYPPFSGIELHSGFRDKKGLKIFKFTRWSGGHARKGLLYAW